MPRQVTTSPIEFQTSGLTLRGDRWPGDDDRASVLLLHGGGQTRHSWDRTAGRLAAEGRTAITLDGRGHGDSDWHPAGEYSLDAYVSDLTHFVKTLDRPPVLVGASLGGIAALAAAGETAGLAGGLVLVDVVVDVEPEGIARIHAFLSGHQNGFATLDEVADAIEAYTPQRKRARNIEGLKKNVRLRSDGRWYWHWDPAFIDGGDEPTRKVETERLRRAAAAVSIPTLIVRGLSSDVVSEDGIQEMVRLIPHAELAEVRAAGHMVAGDDNDVFADRLTTFLTGHETPQGLMDPPPASPRA